MAAGVKMADVGHFGCPNFDRISGHFRSIRNFIFWGNFLTKWLQTAILDVRNSLSIAILTISDRYRLIVFRRPFWMSENHFGSNFWPFQIDRPFWIVRNSRSMAFLAISDPYRTLFFAKISTKGRWRPFWMSANNFRSHFWPFQFDTQLLFSIYFTKWPPAAILDWTTMSIIELVRDIWMSNACVKFEERSLNPSKLSR